MRNKLIALFTAVSLSLTGCAAVQSAAKPATTIVVSSLIKKDASYTAKLEKIADGIETLSKTLNREASIDDFQKIVSGIDNSQEISILVNHIYSVYKDKIVLPKSIENSRLVLLDIAAGIREAIIINSPSK